MQRMKEMRAARGLSLHGLEALTGIDYSALSRYENGRRQPSVRAAKTIASALGVSLDFLVGDHDGEAATSEKHFGKNTHAPVADFHISGDRGAH